MRLSRHRDISIPEAALRDRVRIVWCAALSLCVGASVLAGCGSSDSGASKVPTQCYQPDGVEASLAGCGDTRVCVPDTVAISIDSSTCTVPGNCRWSYAVNVGDTLQYGGGNVWVFLRFGSPIAGITTAEQLAAALWHATFYITFPVEAGGGAVTASYYDEGRNSTGFDVFELVNGRLHVKLSFTVQRPYRLFATSDQSCGPSDTGQCVCHYTVGVPGTIEVDLPVDLPPT